MKLFEVTNGYQGANGYVRCYVVAPSEQVARLVAEDIFKRSATENARADNYWNRLTVREMLGNTVIPSCTEIMGE